MATKTTSTKLKPAAPAALRDDVLIGCRAIADELGISTTRCFHWLATNKIPAVRTGNLYVATRSGLRRHFGGGGE